MENDNGDNCSMTDIGACDEWDGFWGREEGIKLKRMVSRSYQKEKGQSMCVKAVYREELRMPSGWRGPGNMLARGCRCGPGAGPHRSLDCPVLRNHGHLLAHEAGWARSQGRVHWPGSQVPGFPSQVKCFPHPTPSPPPQQ